MFLGERFKVGDTLPADFGSAPLKMRSDDVEKLLICVLPFFAPQAALDYIPAIAGKPFRPLLTYSLALLDHSGRLGQVWHIGPNEHCDGGVNSLRYRSGERPRSCSCDGRRQ